MFPPNSNVEGPGTATVTFGGTGVGQSNVKGGIVVSGTDLTIDEIAFTDTTIKSKLTITGKGGDNIVTVGEVSGSTELAAITAKNTDLIGDGIVLTGTGAIGAITLRNLLNGADIIAPGTGITKGVTLKVNSIGA